MMSVLSRPLHARPTRATDRGFTLIELLVSMALLALVVTVIGGVIISSLRAEETVRDSTTGATDGQLALNVIDADVRSSTALSVTAAQTSGSQFVAIRTAPSAGARCVALYYSASTRELRRLTSTAAIARPANDAATAGWALIASNVDRTRSSSGTLLSVFQADDARTLTVRFQSGRTTPSVFLTTVTGRAPLSNGSPSCF